MPLVSAVVLDGKATRDELFADLRTRVAALRAKGMTAGLGTVIVGDDPGSHASVRGKHNDCAKVGIASIRRDLPATTTPDELFAVIDELNADPCCTAVAEVAGYLAPVPAGAGPMTRAMLLTNVVEAAERAGPS